MRVGSFSVVCTWLIWIYSSYYSNLSEAVLGYKLPLAYFLTGLAIYVYSFVATLRK